jgi:hypothetical protein
MADERGAQRRPPGLIAVIGDEVRPAAIGSEFPRAPCVLRALRANSAGARGAQDTVTGFLLTGIGHRDKQGRTNFLVVDPEKTKTDEIEAVFQQFTTRNDIAIVLITQRVRSCAQCVAQRLC